MIALLLSLLGAQPQVCNATTFGSPGDKYGRSPTVLTGEPVRDGERGIAHRTLPIGSRVVVEHRGRYTIAQVIDRGPYGALDEGGRWFIKRPGDTRGRWRSCADLTPTTAADVGHDGWGRVTIWAI